MNNIEPAHQAERILTAGALMIVATTAVFDFFQDLGEGASVTELVLDLGFSVFVAGALIYIWIRRPQATAARNRQLKLAVQRTREDVNLWKSKAASMLRGLGEKIDEQFEAWDLTAAEKDVALLLIKGASLKEVAISRGTTERTVRQQASAVYTKARLENRAELAAFFLEDLSLPHASS